MVAWIDAVEMRETAANSSPHEHHRILPLPIRLAWAIVFGLFAVFLLTNPTGPQ